jgi:thioredoxin-related protein
MKQLNVIILALVCLISNANSQGIRFTHNLEDALTKAKAENKLVFVDFYTSWCGPCKRLTKEVFPTKEVGDFFNANFINCKIQCDDKGVGVELGKKYGVTAYPTLMLLNSEGDIVHSSAGAPDVKGLIEFAKIAMDPESNLLSITKQWDMGKRDLDFAKVYFNTLSDAYLKQRMKKDFEQFFNSLSAEDKMTKNTFELIQLVGATPFTPIFEFVEDNADKLYEEVGKEEIDYFISNTYLWYLKHTANGSNQSEYEIALEKFKTKEYPYYEEYAQFTGIFASDDENGNYDLDDYQKRGTEFLSKYGRNNDMYAVSLTNLLGNLTGRPNEGTAGIAWMEEVMERNNDPRFLSSYMYIVRRNYQFDKALKIADEIRAIAIANNESTKRIDSQIEEIKSYKMKYEEKQTNKKE